MAQSSNGGFDFPKSVRDASESIKPSYLVAQKVIVEFFPTMGALESYVNVEYSAIQLESQREGVDVTFTEEEFAKYCNTLIQSRVAWVNGDMRNVIIHPQDHIACPSLLDAILKNLGIVFDTRQGLTLVPHVTDLPILTRDRMHEISFILFAMQGYICGTGYIADKSGTVEFMSMQLETETLVSELNVHPAYSTLASVVGPTWTGVNSAPRIKYGDLSVYKELLWQMTSVKLA
jgi:hypothetical protein